MGEKGRQGRGGALSLLNYVTADKLTFFLLCFAVFAFVRLLFPIKWSSCGSFFRWTYLGA